jgi:hypothetical protein
MTFKELPKKRKIEVGIVNALFFLCAIYIVNALFSTLHALEDGQESPTLDKWFWICLAIAVLIKWLLIPAIYLQAEEEKKSNRKPEDIIN